MNILHALYFLSLHLLTRIRMVTDTLEQNIAPKARERRKNKKRKKNTFSMLILNLNRRDTKREKKDRKLLSQQTPTETQREQKQRIEL